MYVLETRVLWKSFVWPVWRMSASNLFWTPVEFFIQTPCINRLLFSIQCNFNPMQNHVSELTCLCLYPLSNYMCTTKCRWFSLQKVGWSSFGWFKINCFVTFVCLSVGFSLNFFACKLVDFGTTTQCGVKRLWDNKNNVCTLKARSSFRWFTIYNKSRAYVRYGTLCTWPLRKTDKILTVYFVVQ